MLEALKLLSESTGGTCDFWALMGPHNAKRRAAIASALAGVKVPQSGAGVTQLRAMFYDIAKPSGDCLTVRERAFAAWAAAQIGRGA